jgi:hypothetical protein
MINFAEKFEYFVHFIASIRQAYKDRAEANREELIRGGCLDPYNHPSLDMKEV